MIQNAKIVAKNANPDDYHKQVAERGTPKYVLSCTQIKEFMRCPSRWKAGYVSPASDAMRFGSLLDCLALTPDDTEKRFIVKPETYTNEDGDEKPWNGNAKVCRKWAADQIKAGIEIISESELKYAEAACKSMLADATIADFIRNSDRQVHLVGEWHDKETGITVPLKALIDLAPKDDTIWSDNLADIKTTRNAEPMAWQRFCFKVGYFIQAALYNELWNAATGQQRTSFCFFLVENYSPWQTAKRLLSQNYMTLGRAEVDRVMSLYCRCLLTGKWPTYDDTDESVQGFSIVEPEPWMAEHAMFAPKFATGEPEEAPGVYELDPDAEVTP
jgi:hypothetical protein